MRSFNPAYVSGIELAWTIPAILAFVLTLISLIWVFRVFAALRGRIKGEPLLYRAWGPRWNFLLLLGCSLGFFGLGWLGYMAIGVVAMLTPPPPQTTPASQTGWWLAMILIGMEVTHALAQGLLIAGLWSLAGTLPGSRRFWRRDE